MPNHNIDSHWGNPAKDLEGAGLVGIWCQTARPRGAWDRARAMSENGYSSDAEALFKRAIAIGEKALGHRHPLTQRYCSHYARLLLNTGRPTDALSYAQSALSIHEATSGPTHHWTKDSARVMADALDAQGRTDEAAEPRAQYGIDGS